jgi:tetratricopeptide (TPR) repeat protein
LALVLGLGPATTLAGAPLALLQPSDADINLAKIEYEKGEKAYRLGQFEDAAISFEKAYEKSGLPDILYNIGLSHLRWYDVDPDIAHLRKAKVVFQNYVIEIQKNPELGDLEEAETLIKQIDEKITEHEQAAAAAAEAANNGNDDDGGGGPIDLGPDPGKKLRLIGAITMGVGGAFVVGGAVSGVVLGVRGQEFEENLANSYAERDDLGCTTGDARPECDQVNEEIDVYRRNGRSANALAVGLGLSFGGLGVIGIVTGAVLFIQGNKKTKTWEARQMSVVPSWGPHGGGLVFSGRF